MEGLYYDAKLNFFNEQAFGIVEMLANLKGGRKMTKQRRRRRRCSVEKSGLTMSLIATDSEERQMCS